MPAVVMLIGATFAELSGAALEAQWERYFAAITAALKMPKDSHAAFEAAFSLRPRPLGVWTPRSVAERTP